MSIMNADFAASILTSMVKEAKEPTKVSKPNTPSDPLKDIVVPQNLVESIVKFDAKKKGIELQVESKVEKVEEVLVESTESDEVEDTKTLNESKVQDIVTRLAALLSEAKEVLQEIGTTTGMLGVNTSKKPSKQVVKKSDKTVNSKTPKPDKTLGFKLNKKK